MVKRCIGIDIGSSHLRAVQILRKGEEFCIEKVFSTQTQQNTNSMPDILKSLISQHRFDRRANLAISMPQNAVFFRNLETDSAGTERFRDLDSSTLEHDFPIQPDEIVAQACSYRHLPGEKYSVLTAAVSRKLLHERLNIFAVAKMHPTLVDAAIFAIHSTVAVNHPEIMTGQAIIAYVNETYLTLAVTQDNDILIVRNIPIISSSGNNVDSVQERIAEVLPHEAQITWQKVFNKEIEENTKIYLVSENGTFDGLETLVEENLHCQTTTVNPYAKVKKPPDYNDGVGICVAEGLALRALVPEATTGINFLDADNANIKPALNLKRESAIFVTLVTAIVVVSLIGLFIRLSHLETKHTQIKNEIRDIFQQVLPEEKNIVNPLVQLEQKLQSLRKDYTLLGFISETGVGPVEILHAISKSIPSEANIKIDNMLITSASVRLTGTSQSFESIYNWQRLLKDTSPFSTVDVQDIRREPESGLAHFTILVLLATPEQK
jgi:Tfp pilus assembly PilM family ATPase/Tfp pilus assembly protein PilN